MKVCFVTNLPVWSLAEGGGAPSFFNTIKMFVDRGHSVTLLTTETNHELRDLKPLRIVNIPCRKSTEKRSFGGLFRLLQKHLNYVMSQDDIIPYLEEHANNADLLYAYEIGFVPGVVDYARKKQIPCVSRFQGTILTDLVQETSVLRKLRLYTQFYDHIQAMRAVPDITVMTDDGTKGDQVLRCLRRNDSSKIHFFKNGVDLPMPDITREKYNRLHSGNDIVFCSVSRLQRWKRVDRSIEIFSRFKARFSNSYYYIVGDGPEKEALEKIVRQKGLHDSVTFLGIQNKSQIYSLLKDTKYFLSSYELSNLGNPLFEAMACGAVVVTLNNGATSEMVIDGVTGIISDESEYVSNVIRLIDCENDPEVVMMMRDAAKNHLVASLESWDQRMEREYNVLELFLRR